MRRSGRTGLRRRKLTQSLLSNHASDQRRLIGVRTDGIGLSESRGALRNNFERAKEWILFAALLATMEGDYCDARIARLAA